ncbi:MAG: hypothetical protein FJY17_02975 [Bacteroidetes bacterium]|nr:hypothetical protein [Bacteroidota bacterium]
MGVSFSLARPKAKNSSIRVKIATQGANFFVYTGKTISPELWDFKKSFIKSQVGNPTAAKASKYLRKIQMDLTEVFDDYRFGLSKMTFLELQAKMHEVVGNPKTKMIKENHGLSIQAKSLIDFVDHFISDCEKGIRLSPQRQKLKESTIKSFRTSKGYLNLFQNHAKKTLVINEITQKEIDAISDYVVNVKKHSLNTHSKFMTDLNQIFKYAKDNKVITQAQFSELKFDTRREETDSIYLKEEEIIEMYNLNDLPSEKHQIVRDVFVAACYMGLRFSDYTSLNLAKIVNNRLEVIQKKTGKKVTLPIHPLVREIFTKYNYRLPKIPNNNEFNRLIKEVGALMPSMQVEFSKQITYERERIVITKPKFQWLQGHCPRRSLVTNEFLKGTDVPTIMSISGHKSYKNFLRYIKASGEEHAEKLEKIWQERYSEIH